MLCHSPDLDSNGLTLKEFFERVNFEKRSVDSNKNMKNYPAWKKLSNAGPQLRVCTKKLIFLFLNQNICCGYSKEPSH